MFRTPDHAPLLNARRAGVAVAASLAVAALVSGCGGGDKVKPFQPTQVIVFGDENSAFDDSFVSGPALVTVNGAAFKGSRYTINSVTQRTTEQAYCAAGAAPLTSIDCAAAAAASGTAFPIGTNPIFTPTLNSVSTFGTPIASGTGVPTLQLVNELRQGTLSDTEHGIRNAQFSIDRYYDCSPGHSAYAGNWAQYMAYVLGSGLSMGGTDQCPQDTGNGISYAKWGYTVDDVIAQINAHRGEFHEGVLVAIMVGQNDIVNAYNEVVLGNMTADAANILMRAKGEQLGAAIKTIPSTGARVVFLTVPDMGKSPKAITDNRVALASELSHSFNEGYPNSSIGGLVLGAASQQGHKIVKVDGYNQINAIAPSYPTAAACDPALIKMPDGTAVAATAKARLLNCTNLTLVTGADINTHLWADDWHLAPVGHVSLGALAVSRVRDQL